MGVADMASTSISLRSLLEALLVADAEALFFVDDEQAEVLELDVFGKQAVGADEDVDLAGFDFLENDFLLLGGAEAGDHLNVNGELREAALECFEMLETEDGCGCKHGDLLAVLHGFEGGAHGDFSFAVAHVAAEEAIHGGGGFHVVLDGADGGELVVGLVVIEGVFEFLLEFVVFGESGALGGVALGVELEQFAGHVLHGLAHAGLGLGPLLGAEPVEDGRGTGVGGTVFLDEIEAGERDVELGGFGEFENHEFDGEAVLHDFFEALVLRDAVFDVDDIVADGEVAEVGDEGRGLGALGLGAGGDVGVVGEIVGAEEDEVGVGKADAGGELRAHDDGDAHVAGEIACFFKHGFAAAVHGAAAEAVRDLVLAQDSGHAFDVALVGGGEDDVRLQFHQLAELLGERGDGAMEAQGGAGVEGDFAEGGVFVEHVDGAELVEIESEVRIEQALQDFGAEIDVFRTDEIADAGALVALLDLVPPAVNLVAHHAGLVDEEDGLGEELEEVVFGARDAGEEFPAGKDADAAGGRGFDGEILLVRI